VADEKDRDDEQDDDLDADGDDGDDAREDADGDEGGDAREDADGDDGDAREDAAEDADGDDVDDADGERAGDVAKALGVGDDDEGEDEDADGAPLNRAERRRLRAQRRRAAKEGEATAEVADSPKDKNKRRRERLLEKRRKAAEAEDEVPPERLLPSEMVDDALARATDRSIKWIRNNWKWLQWGIVGALVAGVGLLVWRYQAEGANAAASSTLAKAVVAEDAFVVPAEEDDRTDEQKKDDIRVIFASYQEKQQAALDAYKQIAGGGSGAAILARLGEAGVLLDRGQWDEAIVAFDEVLATPLAAADPDVKGRALEGRGFAEEGKEQPDAALKSYEAMGELASDTFKLTSLYHRARLLHGQKQKDKASELLVEARKLLEKAKLDATAATSQHPFRWLEREIDALLREVDPTALPPELPGGPGGVLPEHIRQQLMEKGLTPGIPPQ
jgi:hypothetical protein